MDEACKAIRDVAMAEHKQMTVAGGGRRNRWPEPRRPGPGRARGRQGGGTSKRTTSSADTRPISPARPRGLLPALQRLFGGPALEDRNSEPIPGHGDHARAKMLGVQKHHGGYQLTQVEQWPGQSSGPGMSCTGCGLCLEYAVPQPGAIIAAPWCGRPVPGLAIRPGGLPVFRGQKLHPVPRGLSGRGPRTFQLARPSRKSRCKPTAVVHGRPAFQPFENERQATAWGYGEHARRDHRHGTGKPTSVTTTACRVSARRTAKMPERVAFVQCVGSRQHRKATTIAAASAAAMP